MWAVLTPANISGLFPLFPLLLDRNGVNLQCRIASLNEFLAQFIFLNPRIIFSFISNLSMTLSVILLSGEHSRLALF